MDDNNPDIEELESEDADQQAALKSYEILTYPADFTLEGLVQKYHKKEVTIPTFQRKFVWTIFQASRLIDSFLKGLPVPSIFLFAETNSNELLLVDGQQRLRSIAYYFDGYFGEERAGRRPVFRLKGLEKDSPFEGKTYEELRTQHPSGFAKLNNSVLRSFVMRQLSPDDNTSIYHVFERLNTGGTQLSPQEIRNCIHHGKLYDLLQNLNTGDDWRAIFGRKDPDRRQRDVELILRFLALLEKSAQYEKPMKNFLNVFMSDAKDLRDGDLSRLEDVFRRTTSLIKEQLGDKPFHIRAGLNAAVFDSVYVAVAKRLNTVPEDLKSRYIKLTKNDEFLNCVGSSTTDKTTVMRRLQLATEALD